MKEKNLKRKQLLKKNRALILHKKALRSDIATFLVKFWVNNTPDLQAALKELMWDGHRGWDNMRTKELLTHFEDVYTAVREEDAGDNIGIWAQDWDGKRKQILERQEAIESYRLETESLMSRIMELSFNLDFEE